MRLPDDVTAMPSYPDHHHRLQRAKDKLRRELREQWDFREPVAVIETYIIETEEIIMALIDTLTAAKTVIDTQTATIADLTAKLATASAIDPATQAAADSLAAEPAVAAILNPLAPITPV